MIIFNEGVDKFFPLVETGKVYEFSHGRIKHLDKAFATEENVYEISMNASSNIREVDIKADFDDRRHYTSIEKIPLFQNGQSVNLIGIITEVDGLKSVTTKTGKNIVKRNFFLVDDSQKKILCTAWAQLAQHGFGGLEYPLVLIRGSKINDYAGRRTIGIGVSAACFLDVNCCRADELRNWIDDQKSVDFEEIEYSDSDMLHIESFTKK